jgi:hypothetical protein
MLTTALPTHLYGSGFQRKKQRKRNPYLDAALPAPQHMHLPSINHNESTKRVSSSSRRTRNLSQPKKQPVLPDLPIEMDTKPRVKIRRHRVKVSAMQHPPGNQGGVECKTPSSSTNIDTIQFRALCETATKLRKKDRNIPTTTSNKIRSLVAKQPIVLNQTQSNLKLYSQRKTPKVEGIKTSKTMALLMNMSPSWESTDRQLAKVCI